MTYSIKVGLKFCALGFVLFSLGMISCDYCLSANMVNCADYCFGMGLALSMLSIAYGCAEISKPNKTYYIFFMMMVALAFINVGSEITKTAHDYIKLEYWVGLGVVVYALVLIRKTTRNDNA